MYFHTFKEKINNILDRDNWDNESFDVVNLSTGDKINVILFDNLLMDGVTASGRLSSIS